MSDVVLRFIDLSHELADGMSPYPGLPNVHIGPHLDHVQSRSHYDGDEFYLGKVEMPVNVGTYLDTPFHRFSDREDLSQIPLERLVGIKVWWSMRAASDPVNLGPTSLPTESGARRC
jgi:arylformamidase